MDFLNCSRRSFRSANAGNRGRILCVLSVDVCVEVKIKLY